MHPNALHYLEMTRRREQVRERYHKLAIALVSVGAAGALVLTLVFGATMNLYQTTVASYPPLAEQLSVRGAGITMVYDRNGEQLGVLTNPNSAIAEPVPLDRISPNLIAASISTEDNAFWSHSGFSVKGIARAAWENYGSGESTTGGSTITQQLVKTAYFTTDCEEVDGITQCTAPRTVSRKLKEIVLAIDTEERYSKEQILTWYLNSISYSGRYVGAETASLAYFGKPASELTLAEAALLAGIPSAPTRYDPRRNCDVSAETGVCPVDELGRTVLGGEAKVRQEYVLNLMADHGHITREEAESAKAEAVLISPGLIDNKAAAFIDSQVEPRLVRMCQAGLLAQIDGTKDCIESVHTAGYKVTTTLDWTLNQEASVLLNQFLSSGLAAGCGCHNGAIVTIEPASGQVVVYVPNLDPTWVSDVRVAGNIDQVAEMHQPGSSFKPAVYLAWMDTLNKTPMSSIWDTSPMKLVDKPAKPEDQVEIINPGRNASQGLITARTALGGSQNVPAFRAAAEAGIDNVIATAKKLGITTLEQNFDPTFYNHEAIDYGPAIATGGANIRAIDMAYMNATIANMGSMVGVPTYATTLEQSGLMSVANAEGDALEKALRQREAFLKGYTRLPGTRELDPVVVLRVESSSGEVLYDSAQDTQKRETINPGSVWMLHSIMSDCQARFLIWQCGSSNNDLALDFFVNGVKIPGGIKTGTQQGVTAKETLETWMTGYSRYAATAVWIGNADKSLVRDGPEAGYASANTTVRLFKNWMGAYHGRMQSLGLFTTPAGFEELKPANVKEGPFPSATTERGGGGGCFSRVTGWQRTDIDYAGGDCLKACVPLPELKKDLAITMARARRIPACGVSLPAPEASPTPGADATPQLPQQNPPRNVPTQPPGNQPQQPGPNPTQPPGNGGNPNGNGNGNGNNDGRENDRDDDD